MSFYTSLSGLNAATAQLSVTSNNIANVGTTGFKRSRADFGDIFATSPLQKASSTVGQGVSLKQVSQEFSQGNVTSSTNSLDLAISGDGFFPLRSADGLQDLYTRNGSFMLNEQFNVVNSTGQRLMAATVDSTGSANVNERVVLTIPQKTSGEARRTSLVQLGLNFPADAQVISAPFNRADPSTYNKSTAMTVYDSGGNGYLATIYYVKTQNANQDSPFNKWQTYVFVGDEEVRASLMQATNPAGERLYVNQYGQLAPYSQVKREITTAKTQLITLDPLNDPRMLRTSEHASISSTETMDSNFNLTNGIDFSTLSEDQLSNVFRLDVDDSNNPVTVDLRYLKTRTGASTPLTGNQIAAEMTRYLNREFGDQSYFDLSSEATRSFTIATSRIITPGTETTNPKPVSIPIKLTKADFATALGIEEDAVDWKKIKAEDMVKAMQAAFSQNETLTNANSELTVSYDYNTRNFKFTDGANTITLSQGTITVDPNTNNGNSEKPVPNTLFRLDANTVAVDANGFLPKQVLPNGATSIRPLNEQRYGIKVSYDAGSKTFAISSGTTGDKSSIRIIVDEPSGLGKSLFGFKDTYIEKSPVAFRGIASSPAVAYGSSTTNLTNNFTVDDFNNVFDVTVDGIKGTVVIPTGTDYSVLKFAAALEKGINSMGEGSTTNGLTPATINGVRVTYDFEKSRFVFTTGTATKDSFIQVSGSPTWGLEQVEVGRGSTATWVKPTQLKVLENGTLTPKYIDSAGKETSSDDGFTNLPPWSPVFLDKGELTFDTGGKLVSPKGGTQLETVYLEGGKGALTINIDYSASTQYSSSFAVLSQSQDGAPEGDLVGVTIANDGLVSASYSNGTQKSLAKILLVNFSSPTGLRQIGDSSFVASASSGQPILGTAGTSGLGTIRAGATESSNVDLTAELVNLITAQRNFQANAKAIETSTTMTQAIINIRG